jgi:Zn-dependent metalloprotease
VETDAGFTQVVFGEWLGNFLGVTVTGFLDDGQVYFWRVAARNSLGESPFSAPRSFAIQLLCSANTIGTGTGVLNDPKSHIDSCFLGTESGYVLKDETRRANHNPHGHAGRMAPDASIRTDRAGAGLVQDADNIWNAGGAQASGVDAHVYAGWVYDYLNRTHGLNGFDNRGSTMRSVVEVAVLPDGRPCTNNAFWDGVKLNYCVGVGQMPFSGALDAIGHEWGHAVTQYGAGLTGGREPGALDEAFSDWLGTAIEHANGETNWTIGEGIQIARDLSNPLLYGQPATYLGAGWVDVVHCTPTFTNDFCGVHTNSGVANKMFHLLSVGGTHNSVTVFGIGIQQAIRIAIEANRTEWTFVRTFLDARQGMIRAAAKLFGAGSPEVTYVGQAWDAVGVYDPAPPLLLSR